MPPRDYRLAGGYLAQFHVSEGIRREVTPPNPKVKDTARRAHDSIGPRELRRFVGFGIDFLQLKIKTVGMRRRQLSCLYLADRNAFEFMLAQHLQRAAVERTRRRLLTFGRVASAFSELPTWTSISRPLSFLTDWEVLP